MNDYKQTRDAAGKVTKQYDKMLRSLGDDDLVKDWDEYVESMGSIMGEVEHIAQQMRDRIKELEAKLAACEKYRDAYAECDRIATKAVRDLEAKLAKAVEALKGAAKQHRIIAGMDLMGASAVAYNAARAAESTIEELTGEDRG